MSDREFLKMFSGLVGALGVLTVVLIIVANMLGNQLKQEGPDMRAVAERIKPIGELTVGSTGGVNLIGAANAAGPVDGKSVYDTSCAACHTAGVAGSPKLGDKAAWASRTAKGTATLYTNAIKGFQGKAGFMPAKGGNASLSDAQVKAAVDYMVSQAK
jgi:cytochrome c5